MEASRYSRGYSRLFIDSLTGSWNGASFSEAKTSSTPINPHAHNRERKIERASFLVVVAAREATIRSYGPGKLLRFGWERQKRKGCYRALPVSINVAGLFPDISRCRAKIYLLLAERISIDTRATTVERWETMGRELERARTRLSDLSLPVCLYLRTNFAMKKKKKGAAKETIRFHRWFKTHISGKIVFSTEKIVFMVNLYGRRSKPTFS